MLFEGERKVIDFKVTAENLLNSLILEWGFKLLFFCAWLFMNFNLGNKVVIRAPSFAFSSHALSVGLGSKPERRKFETLIKNRLPFRTN